MRFRGAGYENRTRHSSLGRTHLATRLIPLAPKTIALIRHKKQLFVLAKKCKIQYHDLSFEREILMEIPSNTSQNNNINTQPTNPARDPKKQRTVVVVVIAVLLLIIIALLVRASQNREGVRGIFRRNTVVNGTTNSVSNSVSNTTNTPASNQTSNTSNSNGSQGGSNGGTGGNGGSTSDKSKYAAGKSTISFNFGGVARTGIIYVPKSYSPSSAMPLVLSLHGSESDADGQQNLSQMNTAAENNGFIVVYPNGINKQWNDGRVFSSEKTGGADDVGFIMKLIETVSSGMNIDSRRVYAAGMSNGGMMTNRLACEKTSTFAAIAVVAGAMPTELQPNCRPSTKMPIIIMHGTNDPIVPFSGGAMNSGRGSVLSVADEIKFWASNNGVSSNPSNISELTNTVADLTTITKNTYGNTINFYSVNNGGHTWPGGPQYLPVAIVGRASQDMNGTQVIWDFFKQFSR